MLSLLQRAMIVNGPSYQPVGRHSWEEFLGVRAMIVFFSTKAARSGPKVALQTSLCLIALFCVTRFLFPYNVAEVVDYLTAEKPVQDGLRMVVFGSADIATPPIIQGSDDTAAKSWTEELCDELACSTYLSFVPTGKHQTRSLVSNTLYDVALATLLASSPGNIEPGLDYTFLEQNYSVPYDYPDLRAQILEFLAMPAPDVPPSETLWVFSFGTWEVWHLAGFPSDGGEAVIRELAKHMFAQIEMLYRETQNPGSIAYSQPSEAADNDTFRIVLPRLFDPSLAPGWRSRPTPPRPHTNAEHLRNAAYLTLHWNDEIATQVENWALSSEAPEDSNNSGNRGAPATPETMNGQTNQNSNESAKTEVEPEKRGPLRDAYFVEFNSLLVSAMIDAQLRRQGIEDHTRGSQLGSLPKEDSFDDSANTCVSYAEAASGNLPPKDGGDECSRYLFVSDFSVSDRAVDIIVDNALGVMLNNQSVRMEREKSNNARQGLPSNWQNSNTASGKKYSASLFGL